LNIPAAQLSFQLCHFAYRVTWSCVQLFMVLGTI
jgi:hypothetical protein